MVKLLFVISGIIGAGLGLLAMFGGCPIIDAATGGLFCAILSMILGFILWGLVAALRQIGGYISAGVVAFLLLFWHHVLPGLCVEVICHALGVKQ